MTLPLRINRTIDFLQKRSLKTSLRATPNIDEDNSWRVANLRQQIETAFKKELNSTISSAMLNVEAALHEVWETMSCHTGHHPEEYRQFINTFKLIKPDLNIGYKNPAIDKMLNCKALNYLDQTVKHRLENNSDICNLIDQKSLKIITTEKVDSHRYLRTTASAFTGHLTLSFAAKPSLEETERWTKRIYLNNNGKKNVTPSSCSFESTASQQTTNSLTLNQLRTLVHFIDVYGVFYKVVNSAHRLQLFNVIGYFQQYQNDLDAAIRCLMTHPNYQVKHTPLIRLAALSEKAIKQLQQAHYENRVINLSHAISTSSDPNIRQHFILDQTFFNVEFHYKPDNLIGANVAAFQERLAMESEVLLPSHTKIKITGHETKSPKARVPIEVFQVEICSQTD